MASICILRRVNHSIPMQTNWVYEYADPREFLAAALAEKQRRHPGFSIRAWARQCGLRAPSLLSAILRGERTLRPNVGAQLARTLELTDEEAKYFNLIVLIGSARTTAEKEAYLRLLKALRPETTFLDLDVERFRLVADWYHFAVLEMIDLKDFRTDPEYLSRRLGGKVSAFLISGALERLERMGLITRERKNWRKGTMQGNRKVGDALPSQAIRQHHLQMIEKAKAAITDLPMETRDIRGTTIAIRREDYAKATEILRECHQRLQKLAADDADEVYRLNTQLFPLTHRVTP